MFSRVVDTLEILTYQEETQETREDAGLLLSALQMLSFLCFRYIWEPILSEVGIRQKNTYSKKIWTLFSVRHRFGIWMTFCGDKENHWLPTHRPKQQTFVKRWELPLNEEFPAAEECPMKRLRMLVARASQRNVSLFGFSISRDSPEVSANVVDFCDRLQFLKRPELLREDTSDENGSAYIRKLTSSLSILKNLS